MHERVEDRKRLQKYEHTELTLDDEQSDELSQVVHTISAKSPGREVLSQIFEEEENPRKGQIVRDIWESDMRSQFHKDESRNGHYSMTFLSLSLSLPFFQGNVHSTLIFFHCREWKEK